MLAAGDGKIFRSQKRTWWNAARCIARGMFPAGGIVPGAVTVSVVLSMLGATSGASAATPCVPTSDQLGVSRIVSVDASNGPLYGQLSAQTSEPHFLKPMEVVLTFDDGPSPLVTKPILDVLDRHCTKATFFSVGRMAITYPFTLKDIIARGHTLGTHTWSHPKNLPRLRLDRAIDQIERGFAAVTLAAGQPIAPFFRFPGLNDNPALLTYLQSRGIGTFTVDVVSNDSFINDPEALAQTTLEHIRKRKGGIVLFHDIKPQTAVALPVILTALKREGYKIVHLRAPATIKPKDDLTASVRPMYERRQAARAAGEDPSQTETDDGAALLANAVLLRRPLLGGYAPSEAIFRAALIDGALPMTTLKAAARERKRREQEPTAKPKKQQVEPSGKQPSRIAAGKQPSKQAPVNQPSKAAMVNQPPAPTRTADLPWTPTNTGWRPLLKEPQREFRGTR